MAVHREWRVVDTGERLTKLRRDLANYRQGLKEATDEYAKQANLILAIRDMIKETEETIEWLESGGWDAVTSDY